MFAESSVIGIKVSEFKSPATVCKDNKALEVKRRGCCSWHGGVSGCSGGRVTCNDGIYSPSCTCVIPTSPLGSRDNKKNRHDISNCRGITAKDMTAAGKSATRAAKRLLTLKKQYSYSANGKDRYGRSICVVELDTLTFSEQMIINGFAIPYRQYMNSSELKHYNVLLKKAKMEKVGLWRDREAIIECLNRAKFNDW